MTIITDQITHQYKILLEINPLPIWIYDIQTFNILMVNQAAIDSYGYSIEEFMNMTVLDVRPNEDVPLFLGHFKNFNKRAEKSGPWKHCKKNGDVFFVEIVAHNVKFDGKDARLVFIYDVTERIKAEKELKYRYEIEKLIADISTHFVNLPVQDIDLGIYKALVLVGEFYGLSGCSIWLSSQDEKLVTMTYEWVSDGVIALKDVIGSIPFEKIPWAYDIFKKKKIVYTDVDKIPTEFKEEKRIMSLRGANGILAIPMLFQRNIKGFMFFSSGNSKNYVTEDMYLFKMLSEIIVNALDRKHNESVVNKLFCAIAQTADSVVITDKNGIIEYVNPAFERLTGYSQEEVLGKKPNLLKSGKHNDQFYKRLWDTVLSGEVYNAEFINKSKNGELFYQEGLISPIKDSKGNLINIISVGHDVTEKKEEEKKLRLLSASINQTSEGLAVSDLSGKLIWLNNAFAELHDYKVEELIDKHLSIFHTEEQMEQVNSANRKMVAEGRFKGEIWHKRRNGSIFPALMNNTLLYDENNKPVGMIATMQDITDIKKAEVALKKNEELYRLLVENQSDLLVKFDLNGKFLYVSQSYCDLLGKKREEIINSKFVLSIHEDDKKFSDEWMKLLINPPFRCEIEQRELTKMGWRWLSWSYKTELSDQGEALSIIGVGRDITEKKAAEEEIERTNKLLEQKVKDIEILLGEVTKRKKQLEKLSRDLVQTEESERRKFAVELHDSLGQILTSLKINLELANSSISDINKKTESYLKECLTLIHEAMQETKQLSYDLRPSVLDDFGLNAAFRMLVMQFQKRSNIQVELNLSTRNTRYDPIIEATIYRIAQETLTNVAKHANAKKAWIQLIERNDVLAFSIIDDGKGFNAEEYTYSNEEVIHFGLRNIRERVEFLGGKLYIESVLGKGTEISIEIDLKSNKTS